MSECHVDTRPDNILDVDETKTKYPPLLMKSIKSSRLLFAERGEGATHHINHCLHTSDNALLKTPFIKISAKKQLLHARGAF